jgi:K+-sensing histidine kinase KdpD
MTAKSIEEGFVLAFRDIIPSKEFKVTQDCNIAKEDKNLFLLKLANDFKSPLQSIVGFSQAMTDGLGGSISLQQEKYIKIINKNSSELMYFINKLMELTQTESECISPDIKMFDIINTVNSVLSIILNIPRSTYRKVPLRRCGRSRHYLPCRLLERL